MIIYKIINSKNGKFYIGKTKGTIARRFYDHLKQVEYGGQTVLCSAIRKHGKESFTIEAVEEWVDYFDGELLNQREVYWIAKLSPHYNMTKGGDGGWTYDQTGNTWKVKDPTKMGLYWKQGRQSEVIDYSKNSSGNNYQSIYKITTPWGVFETWQECSIAAKRERAEGNLAVVTDIETIQVYCRGKKLHSSGKRTHPSWRGKHTHDLGFGVELK